jgi:hypothetical protein
MKRPPYFDFPNQAPEPDLRKIRVIPCRPMLLKVDGEMRHCPAGRPIRITVDECARLSPDDYTVAPRRGKRARS